MKNKLCCAVIGLTALCVSGASADTSNITIDLGSYGVTGFGMELDSQYATEPNGVGSVLGYYGSLSHLDGDVVYIPENGVYFIPPWPSGPCPYGHCVTPYGVAPSFIDSVQGF